MLCCWMIEQLALGYHAQHMRNSCLFASIMMSDLRCPFNSLQAEDLTCSRSAHNVHSYSLSDEFSVSEETAGLLPRPKGMIRNNIS